MEFQNLRCPNCDAALESINGIDHYKCPYCQSEILIDLSDGVLKARIAKTEYDFKIWKARHDSWEKEQDFQRSEIAKDNKAKRKFYRTALLIFALIFFCFLPSIVLDVIDSGYTSVPFSANQFEEMSIDEAVHALRSAGFKKH